MTWCGLKRAAIVNTGEKQVNEGGTHGRGAAPPGKDLKAIVLPSAARRYSHDREIIYKAT